MHVNITSTSYQPDLRVASASIGTAGARVAAEEEEEAPWQSPNPMFAWITTCVAKAAGEAKVAAAAGMMAKAFLLRSEPT